MNAASALVLLVEDEPNILELLRLALEDAGFAVTTAMTGEAAFSLLDGGAHDIRALVTDVNLVPGRKTGWDVAHHARGLVAGLPVIYLTGGAAHEWTLQGVTQSVLLTKPFVLAQVVSVLTGLLNAVAAMVASAPQTQSLGA